MERKNAMPRSRFTIPMTRLLYASLSALAFATVFLHIQPSRSPIAPWATEAEADKAALHPVTYTPQFFGMHTLSPSRHWPTVPFADMRPAGVTWGALEPARGQFDWRPLDFWLSQTEAHGVQFDYVFLNVPAWTSTRPNEPCAGKRTGCAAPPHLEDWDTFVRALVTRYKGRISSYELWNEPNASGYWSGTPKQMAELAQHAYTIIKSVDPNAIVATPAASSTGWPMAHDAWLDAYINAGGGRYADVIAWHGYSGRNDRPALPPEELTQQIYALRAVMAKHHMESMPIWNTEGGWGKDAQLPDEAAQASFLMRWYLIQFSNDVTRAYWYQWDNPEWGTLWREGTGVEPAGHAFARVHRWIEGTTAVSPCRPSAKHHEIWTCELEKGSERYRAAWSTEGDAPYADAAQVASYEDVSGAQHSAAAGDILIGQQPVLLKLK